MSQPELPQNLFIATTLISSTVWLFWLRPKNAGLLRLTVSAFVLAHTLFIAKTLIKYPPPNLFTALNLKYSVTSDTIRDILRKRGEVSAVVESLLTRLSSFNSRTAYIRYGHKVLLDCSYCTSPLDYAIHAIPATLLQYTRTAAVVGVVTLLGTGRERWRTLGVGFVIAAAAAEAWWTASSTIEFPPDGSKPEFMVHDDLYRLRHMFFLVLPLLLSILPKRFQGPSPLTSLPDLHNSLNQTLTRTHLATHTRATLMRVPSLRDQAVEWWDRQRSEGEEAMRDEQVQNTADKLGMGYNKEDKLGQEIGPLRAAAHGAVDGMFCNGLSPPAL